MTEAITYILKNLQAALDEMPHAPASSTMRRIEEAILATKMLSVGYDDFDRYMMALRTSKVPDWTVIDKRTGAPVTVAAYHSKSGCYLDIERWRERDKKGGREMMPYLEARKLKEPS